MCPYLLKVCPELSVWSKKIHISINTSPYWKLAPSYVDTLNGGLFGFAIESKHGKKEENIDRCPVVCSKGRCPKLVFNPLSAQCVPLLAPFTCPYLASKHPTTLWYFELCILYSIQSTHLVIHNCFGNSPIYP